MVAIVIGMAAWLAFSLTCGLALLAIGWLDGSFTVEPAPIVEISPAPRPTPEPDIVQSKAA